MKKPPLKTGLTALLYILAVFLLLSCIQPVDVDDFQKKVKDGVIIDIKEPEIGDNVLEFAWNGITILLEEGYPPIKVRNGDTIKVTNDGLFSEIEWFFNGEPLASSPNPTLTIDSSIFSKKGTYLIYIMTNLKENGAPCSTYLTIEVME